MSVFQLGIGTNRALVWTVVLSIILQAAIILTPPVRVFFKVVPFAPHHWLFAFGVGVLPLAAMEIWKAAIGGKTGRT